MGKHFTKAALCLAGICCLGFGTLSGNLTSGIYHVYAAEAQTESDQASDRAQTVAKDEQLVTAVQPNITMSATDVLGNLVDEDRLFYTGEFEGKFVVNAEPYLEIHESGDESSEVLGKLYPASWGEVEEWGKEWTKVTSGTVTGYIPTEEVRMGYDAEQLAKEVGDSYVTVNVDSLYIRSEADQSSEILSSAIQDEEFPVAKVTEEATSNEEETSDGTTVTADEEKSVSTKTSGNGDGQEAGWVRIQYDTSDESAIGYVAGEFVTEHIELNEAVSIEEEEAAKAAEEAEKAAAQEAASESGNGTDASENGTQGAASEDPQQTSGETPVYATSDETYLLACMVYVESGAESYEGQLGVANVIMNRVRSPLFPNTISEVIYQSGQFPGAHNGVLDGVLASGPSESCMRAAQEALAGVNNIGDFLYFNGWVDISSVGSYMTIGNHTFYNY